MPSFTTDSKRTAGTTLIGHFSPRVPGGREARCCVPLDHNALVVDFAKVTSSLSLFLLAVIFVSGSSVPLHAQTSQSTSSEQPGVQDPDTLQDEQSRPEVNKTAERVSPTTNPAANPGLPALVMIRETVDTNIVSWTNASGFGEKLDWLHMKTFRTAQAQVDMVDYWFRPPHGENRIIDLSRFRLGVFGEGVRRDDKLDFAETVDFDTDIELPNMKRHMKLVFTTRDQTALPGRDITEDRDRSLRTTIEEQWWPAVSTAIGGRLRSSPDLFANVAWSPKWKAGDWLLYPQAKAYWNSSDGFGAISTLVIDHWTNGWNLRCTTSIKCSQLDWKDDRQTNRLDEGFRWSEVLIFGYAKEFLDETKIERIVAGDDVARGLGIRLAAFGGFHSADEYRAGVFVRWPVRKRWMYLLVAPDINWKRENGWEHEWTLKCGVEMLFWGSKTR